MNPIDIIVIVVILLIVGGSTLYIVRAKKKGNHCIGCPHSKSCSKGSNCCSCNTNNKK